MTDLSANSGDLTAGGRTRSRLRKRNRSQIMLQACGIAAISFAGIMLFILLSSLVSTGYKALTQTHITLEVFVDPEQIKEERLPRGGFRQVLAATMLTEFPDVEGRANIRKLTDIL
ncbi:MAG: DUF3333 domain-containing protein, partial [Pseudomonadota bacterium]